MEKSKSLSPRPSVSISLICKASKSNLNPGNLGLAAIYERLFDQYLSIARERETTEMGESQRVKNVHSMAAADLAFRLLGTSIGEPCSVDGSETCGEASFALYNYARLVHILKVTLSL